METHYKLSEIKPIGNFDVILETANKSVTKLEAKNQYTPKVAELIKLMVAELGLLDALETFETPYAGWNMEEQKICLLYLHILLIRLNNIAQVHLNNIDMPPVHIQLMDYVNGKPHLKKVFGTLKITNE